MTKIGPMPKSAVLPSRRSGRPTAQRVAEIDFAIRDAAQRVFSDTGFEAASMDAVAALADVSKGTLYARYGSKEVLFRAIVEDLLLQLSARAGEQDHVLPDDLEKRLCHYADVLFSAFGWPEYALATRLVNNAANAFPEIADVWHKKGTQRYLALIAEDIARLKITPTCEGIDAAFLANLFLHGLAGWHRTESAKGPVNTADATAHRDNMIRVLMATV
jgi:TetR/AcrR family transcriptional regulator, mexJK operon transcriptional repressor